MDLMPMKSDTMPAASAHALSNWSFIISLLNWSLNESS